MHPWPETHPFKPPGGHIRIYEVPDLRVPISHAVRQAAPDTSPGSLIWNIPDGEVRLGTFVLFLLNFGEGIHGFDAVRWAVSRQMVPSDFRDVCAICAHKPDLQKDLIYENTSVVSTDTREVDEIWRTGCIWLGPSRREAAYVPFKQMLDSSTWLAFR